MLTKEEISALRNRKTAAIETKMKKVHEGDYYKDGIDHYYQIRSKKNPEKVDMRRFLTVYDPPKSIVTENTRIDGVYKTAEYLKYVDFVSRPDVEKVEIYGFKKTQEFADKYMVDSQTLYYWRSKDAFKKRVVDTIQKQTTSLAANVARI